MGGRNYRAEVFDSPLAYRILAIIARKKEISPTSIANEIESSPKTVSNYLKGLRENGFVHVAKKEGRKSLYTIDYESLNDYHHESWMSLREEYGKKEEPIEQNTHPQDLFETLYKDPHPSEEEIESTIEDDETLELNKRINAFVINYLKNYLQNIDESSITKMAIEDFSLSLLVFALTRENEKRDYPDWFEMYLQIYTPVITKMTAGGEAMVAIAKSFSKTKNTEDVDDLLPEGEDFE